MTAPILTNPVTVVTIRVPGSQGPIGVPGPGNSISIGTVSTTAAGTSATANITGTSPTQVLNLTVPKGDTGPANTLAAGTITTGAAGSSAAFSVTGTAPNQTLNLTVPRGDKGDQGNVGPTNSLAIGTVSTGVSGSSAVATITGTAPSQILNLTIPRGTDGTNGPANTLAIGTVTTGVAGSSAAATFTGTSPNQTLNLTIPRGNAGQDGAPASLTIGTVTTLAAGSSATASVTGTAPNQTLNLSLPQGAKGDTGNVGPIGQSYGGGFAAPTANGNLPLTLNIVSNWGITDAGVAYYTNTGAPANEAGLMMPNIDTGSFSVWRPGAPYQQAGSTTATNNSLVRRTATGTAIAAVATQTTELTTLGQQNTAIAAAGVTTETANTVVRRDALGDIYVTDAYASAQPTVASQLTRKDYVDSVATRLALFETAPIIRRTRTAAQNIPNGSFTPISWDTALTDTVGTQWVVGTPTRLICKRDGWYNISAVITFLNARGARTFCTIQKNGNFIPASTGFAAASLQEFGATAKALCNMIVGDYIEISAYQDSGAVQPTSISGYATTYVEWIWERGL